MHTPRAMLTIKVAAATLYRNERCGGISMLLSSRKLPFFAKRYSPLENEPRISVSPSGAEITTYFLVVFFLSLVVVITVAWSLSFVNVIVVVFLV